MWLTELQASHEFLVSAPIKDECFLSVVIPVRNEAEHLFQTLECLAQQVDLKNHPFSNFDWFEIIFLVNNSDDDSAKIIRRWSKRNSGLTVHLTERNLLPENSNIGYVRRWLMNEAFLRLLNNKFGKGIIATTDGDTMIAPNWISATVNEIERGAEAVGGRILLNPSELQTMNDRCRNFHLRDTGYRLMTAEIESYFDRLAHDSLPRHHQHFNGSFAVTTQAFEAAGGIPKVRFLEDIAFYHALLRVDARFRHSPHVRVQTSARSEGRTEAGLSTQITQWTLMGRNGDDYLVESAAAIKNRLNARRDLRRAWINQRENKRLESGEVQKLADNLMIPNSFLREELQTPQTFGGLLEKIYHEQHSRGEWAAKNPPVAVEKAIYDLRLMLESLRRKSTF